MTKLHVAIGAGGGIVAGLLIATLASTQLRERRVTGVVLTPDSIDLAPGGTHQFRAHGLVNISDTVAVKAQYRATGGAITAGGLYTAGAVPGSYQVIAMLRDDDHEGLEFDWDDDGEGADDGEDDDEIMLADSATVTVTGTGASHQAP